MILLTKRDELQRQTIEKIIQIAQQEGFPHIPIHIYDLDAISAKTREFLAQIPAVSKLAFALKCNRDREVIQTLLEEGCTLEINNEQEADIAMQMGVPLEETINSSPITPPHDLRYLLEHGVKSFCIDSASQINQISREARRLDANPHVYLRIDVSNVGSLFDLSRLGAHPSKAADLLNMAGDFGLIPEGLTFHVGSQCENPDNWKKAIQTSSEIFSTMLKYGIELTVLDIGGGFPARYTEKSPLFSRVASTINEALRDYIDRSVHIWAEPGRFLVADAGWTVCSITQLDESFKEEGKTIGRATINYSAFSGLTELFECDHFTYPIYAHTQPNNERSEMIGIYDIIGSSCAGTDYIARGVQLQRLAEGDAIIIALTGAYNQDAYGNLDKNLRTFNGANFAKKVYVRKGKVFAPSTES
ncbi:hypothetical protein D6783_01960 [Candidatus Woesearchaeota archaeon]|nr:MAG: hypothetical protein D6783_01960 [Candidatus Woesearchaeota archaeon]